MSILGRLVTLWDAQANKRIEKIENLFSLGWHAGIVGTFISLEGGLLT
jgi:hypothetical protein